jgi:hypothetical protein
MKQPDNFGYCNSQKRLSTNLYSDRVRRDNMSECNGRKDHEVRPQDPSCMAYYSHMNALC